MPGYLKTRRAFAYTKDTQESAKVDSIFLDPLSQKKKKERNENNLLPTFPTEDLFSFPEKKNNYSFVETSYEHEVIKLS